VKKNAAGDISGVYCGGSGGGRCDIKLKKHEKINERALRLIQQLTLLLFVRSVKTIT
jgi:hypothetical protein